MKNKIMLVFGILLVLNLLVGVSAFGYSEDDDGNAFLETEDEVKVPSITIRDLFVLQPSSEPSNPELGMIYFDANSKRLRLYDGTGWYSIALEKVSSISKEQAEKTIEKKREAQTCSESIECGDWGDCINNYQSVTCITIGESCNKYEDVETRDCVVENPFEEEIIEAGGSVETITESEQVETEEAGVESVEETPTEESTEEVIDTEESEEVAEEEAAPEPESEPEPAEEVPAEETIPEELFDITFDLEENTLSGSDKLVVWITLQNFGKRYVPARLIYTVTGEQGKEVYRKFEEVRVYSDESIIKRFDDLTLDQGKYNLKLEVEYAGIVEDFELGFSVETGIWAGIKRFFGGLF